MTQLFRDSGTCIHVVSYSQGVSKLLYAGWVVCIVTLHPSQ